MKVGIIGYGVVGSITGKVLGKAHEIFPYDKYKEPHNSPRNLEELAKNSEVVFVCVPTPMKPRGDIDYSAIHNSINLLQENVERQERNPRDILVTIRSTAVSGTTDSLAEKYPFNFAFNPEFLREKTALEDMLNTDRVVIGANDEESRAILEAVYRPLFPHARYIFVNTKTAEMIKYAANAFLASQIAIANEIEKICQHVGVDYKIVKNAILHDGRIGRNIDVPGHDGDRGFGGKCFPKDLNALIELAREHRYRPYLLEEVWRLNLVVRKKHDWLDIPGATSENTNFEQDKKDVT